MKAQLLGTPFAVLICTIDSLLGIIKFQKNHGKDVSLLYQWLKSFITWIILWKIIKYYWFWKKSITSKIDTYPMDNYRTVKNFDGKKIWWIWQITSNLPSFFHLFSYFCNMRCMQQHEVHFNLFHVRIEVRMSILQYFKRSSLFQVIVS